MTPSSLQKRISAVPEIPGGAPSSPQQAEPAGDALQLLAYARTALERLGLASLAGRLSVRWNARMRSTAGLAYPNRSQIVLNPRLAGFGWPEVERTLLHELAHLIAHERCGRRRIAPHGPEWRRACADLGLKNESRCHDLPLPRRKMARRFVYQCPACAEKIERVRLFRRPAACLKCCQTHCGGRYDKRFNLVRVLQPDLPFAD
jgi:predicted SprT family Zn-dependent metalloprotease